ncbi:xanthine dehydrogenase accessory protein XdhC [Rhodobacter sp. Har01]|uniref:xanthine dehydrogenase accessory protein XdhC n=1 Tax=Rhodobacter sp. Har01 TaxID=2883999 RepID=UPI001D080349|nr:xanthine dehydrogenase accessory protein XdhC [Rhodobacter sp. Har01]MCB6179860.1 xanthine dehydrogenase accessory protein XdhC [Rhodobacter sp. Har01]
MFDLEGLRAAVARHGRVARVVVAGHDGSSPREVGAAMLVWEGGQSGTIGGGALEWQAEQRARAMLESLETRVERVALGPSLDQCCGGAVTLVVSVYDADRAAGLQGEVIATGTGEMPLAVRRRLAAARGAGVAPAPGLVQGWMVEPVARPEREVWVWGAGHVGRALVSVLAPLPGLRLTWVDVASERFPAEVPEAVTVLPAVAPEALVARAPVAAEHLLVTYSHALDLELCHRLLGHGFRGLGLIGSATKAARFRARLAALGHSAAQIARIRCPIGDPGLGKHPQAIAIGVAVGMIREAVASGQADDRNGTG